MLVLTTEERETRTIVLSDAVERLNRDTPDPDRFFELVFGEQGVVMQLFPHKEERRWLIMQPAYKRLEELWVQKRRGLDANQQDKLPMRIITVRLPKCDHDRLKIEAHAHGLSLNHLCLLRLNMPIKEGMLAP